MKARLRTALEENEIRLYKTAVIMPEGFDHQEYGKKFETITRDYSVIGPYISKIANAGDFFKSEAFSSLNEGEQKRVREYLEARGYFFKNSEKSFQKYLEMLKNAGNYFEHLMGKKGNYPVFYDKNGNISIEHKEELLNFIKYVKERSTEGFFMLEPFRFALTTANSDGKLSLSPTNKVETDLIELSGAKKHVRGYFEKIKNAHEKIRYAFDLDFPVVATFSDEPERAKEFQASIEKGIEVIDVKEDSPLWTSLQK